MVSQAEFLPTKGLLEDIHGHGRSMREELGIVIGDVKEGDEIWTSVVLPEGWSLRASGDHAMYSDLVDERGRPRAQIFYKAVFYDRKAHIFPPNKRYRISSADPERYGATFSRPWPAGVECPHHEMDDYSSVSEVRDGATDEVLFSSGVAWHSEHPDQYNWTEQVRAVPHGPNMVDPDFPSDEDIAAHRRQQRQ